MMRTIYNTIKAAVYVAALLCINPSLYAQEQEENTNLNREMTLEREYDPSVQDANKVNTLPAIKEPEITKAAIDYSTFTLAANPDKEVKILPSGKILANIDYDKHRGYLNFGAGTYLNLNGDFGYRLVNTGKDHLGITLSHRSMNGTLKYVQYDGKVKARFNDNLGGLSYSHIFDKATFNAGADYGYSSFNYYGMPISNRQPWSSSITMTDTETNQVAQTIQAYMGVRSAEESMTGYLLNLKYTNFSYKYGISPDTEGATEHTASLKGGLNTETGTDQRAGIDVSLDYFNYNVPSDAYNTNHTSYAEIGASPYYRVAGGNWNINLGANLFYITHGDSKFLLTPNITVDATIAGNTILYGAATGKVQSNSMYGISRMFRYVDPTWAIAPTRHQLNSVIGVKSGVIPGFWFDLFGGYDIIKDGLLFTPRYAADGNFGNLSTTVSGINVNRTFFGANIKYSYQKYFDLFVKGVYYLVDDPEYQPIFESPEIEINTSLVVRPVEKLSVALDFNFVKGKLLRRSFIPLDDIQELNLTGSYAFNTTFGFYAKLNNLLFREYDLYYGYPAQGFNVMAGINLNF